MKCYVVGGAVRDQLLGRKVRERDWVVIGARPEDMTARGFQPIGRDFPVFLHPRTKEEYALARTERKQGIGYRGFAFCSEPDVSLWDDLRRRDLTINAMALDERGALIDPWGGRADLDAGVLRHTSEAFMEDPLRILRCARFLARFHSSGFTVAEGTRRLLRRMAASHEIETLSRERVWVETAKGLMENSPHKFFELLAECDALGYWYRELGQLFGVPQPARHHPEIDCGTHTLMVLEQTAKVSSRLATRFAALCHDLGKGRTSRENLPSHHGHEERGVPLVDALCDRLAAPKEVWRMARLTCRYHTHIHRARQLRAETIMEVFDAFDLWRRPEGFDEFLIVCQSDLRGRRGFESVEYEQKELFMKFAAAARSVDERQVIEGVPPARRAAVIRQARLARIRSHRVS